MSPSKCLVFEDTSAGVEAAAGAEMIAIAVPNQFTTQQDFSKATCILDASNELSLNALLLLEKT
ncbi:MAG: hypothetical protein JSR80_05090 [Verrucomicrobia bacterium]|nr:hypothetical protein [Verrucomicrobiota bacterium]